MSTKAKRLKKDKDARALKNRPFYVVSRTSVKRNKLECSEQQGDVGGDGLKKV